MRTESLSHLTAQLWRKRLQIRNHLNGIGRQLGELASSESGKSGPDLPCVDDGPVENLLVDLRDLERLFASEVSLNSPPDLFGLHPEFTDEIDSIARQCRALQEQLENLIRLAASAKSPGFSWSNVLWHFHLFASPFQAYLLQRSDLQRQGALCTDTSGC